MTFKDLQIGDYFIFPNHIPNKDGVPSPFDVNELEVFQKLQPNIFTPNEVLCMKIKVIRGIVDSNTLVIKLIF